MRSKLHFLGQYLRNPTQIGAIAPSSRGLAEAMTRPEWLGAAEMIVELGPGDGPITQVIHEKIAGAGSKFFALEINDALCRRLRAKFPTLAIYCDSAARLKTYLDKHDAPHADCIVSSIPWASFDAALQREIMNEVLAIMPGGGRFITFTYVTSLMLPSGRRYRQFLDSSFARVSVSPVVWRNLPPAVVYECIK